MSGIETIAAAAGAASDDVFMKMLNEAAASEEDPMPERGTPEYLDWLERVTQQISKRALSEGAIQGTEEDGTSWVMVQPEAVFVVKALSGEEAKKKVFINICKSDKIKPPQPFGDPDEDGEIRYRVPLSAGPARQDVDRQGQDCSVYDVIFNTETIARAKKEPDFRELIITLALTYLKQKSEPHLEDKYSLPKMVCKGKIEPQRIRIEGAAKQERKLGDLALPKDPNAPTQNPVRHGQPLIKEIEPKEEREKLKTSSQTLSDSTPSTKPPAKTPQADQPAPSAAAKPLIPNNHSSDVSSTSSAPKATQPQSPVSPYSNGPSVEVACSSSSSSTEPTFTLSLQGTYDWSAHNSEDLEGFAEATIPELMNLEIVLPEGFTLNHVNPEIQPRKVDLHHALTGTRLLSIPLPFATDANQCQAKYLTKKRLLRLTLRVVVPQSEIEDKKREAQVASLLNQEAEQEVERMREAHLKLLEAERIAAESRAKDVEREKEVRSRAEKRIQDLELRMQASSAAREKESMERVSKMAEEGEFRSVYGNNPKQLKDVFGVQLKNRHLFALDTDI